MRIFGFLSVFLAVSPTSYGQGADYQSNLRVYFEAEASDRADALLDLLDSAGVERDYAAFAKMERRSEALDRLNLRRNDQDVAASGRTDGATALASVAGVVNTVSVAVENGGFTQATNGTAATIRLKPVAIYNAFAGNSLSPCRQYLVLASDSTGASCGTTVDKWFKGISVSVSLDTITSDTVDIEAKQVADGSGDMSPTGNGGRPVLSLLSERRSITGFSARWEIYNKRDARNASFVRAWNSVLDTTEVQNAADQLALAENALRKRLQMSDEESTEETSPEAVQYQEWKQVTEASLETARVDGWEALLVVWAERLEGWGQLDAVRSIPELEALDSKRLEFIRAENDTFEKELQKPIVSFEYSNLRPLNQPSTSNIRFLLSNPFSVDNEQEGMISFNGGLNLYNDRPAGVDVGWLRDVHAALQFDMPLSTAASNRPPLFTLAAYYQYQIEPGIIAIEDGTQVPNTTIQLPDNAMTLLGPKGGIFIAQAKLTFKAADNAVKVPISVSWANRTELLDAAELRGNIGFQFDWDSLLGGTE